MDRALSGGSRGHVYGEPCLTELYIFGLKALVCVGNAAHSRRYRNSKQQSRHTMAELDADECKVFFPLAFIWLSVVRWCLGIPAVWVVAVDAKDVSHT